MSLSASKVNMELQFVFCFFLCLQVRVVFVHPSFSPILKGVYESIVTILIQSIFHFEMHQKNILKKLFLISTH
jgi:hypothetical protein